VLIALGNTALATASASLTQYRYKVDVQNSARVFVIAYDNLTYSVNGSPDSALAASSVRKVNLAGVAGPVATVTLSGAGGYVYVVSDSAGYESDNSSNDQMILARGRNGYVDTEFLLYNAAMTVNSVNPGKIVVTAMEDNASVTITDLNGGTDTESGVPVRAGQAFVKQLSYRALFRVTSDKPVSVCHGILSDGHAEVMPTTNGGLVGAEAFVATANYIGVVRSSAGTSSSRSSSGGT